MYQIEMFRTKKENLKRKSNIKFTGAGKKTIAMFVALVFALGTFYVPCSSFSAADEARAADKISEIAGDYVEGEVIVVYVDTDDMDLTKKQENKSENLLGDSEDLMDLDEVSLADVDVNETKLNDDIIEDKVVDETIALVQSDDKSTEELMEELAKLPNVDSVEPNMIFTLDEDEQVSGKETDSSGTSEDGVSEEATSEGNSAASEEQQAVEAGEEESASAQSVEAATTSDYTGKQWAYNGSNSNGVNIPDWNDSEKTNATGTVVAVMDTGIDYNHEDLDDVMWSDGDGYHGYDFVNSDKYPMDDYGHGTHCAGIIAAEWNGTGVSGAANGTELMAVKAGDSNGKFYLGDILNGYEYLKGRINAGINVVAVNNSWGGLASSAGALNSAVSELGELGAVSVFASGNDGEESYADCDKTYTDGTYLYKHLCSFLKDNQYAIVVDSTDSYGSLSSFSNYGATTTHVAAPGSSILSTIRISQGSYVYMQGTSMATPVVSGEVAIVSSYFDSIGADVIAGIIKTEVSSKSGLTGKCESGGIVNVSSALKADPKEIKYKKAYLSQTEFVYDGTEKKPTVTVRNLTEGEAYTVTYPDNNYTKPGTHSVTIQGTASAGYYGTRELTFNIAQRPLKLVLSSSSFIYNGAYKSVSVSGYGAGSVLLTNGTHYTVNGTTSAKLPGTYALKITPKESWDQSENYSASSSASFRIAVKPSSIKKLKRYRKAFTVRVYKQSKTYVSGYQVRYSLYSSMSGAKYKTIGTKYNRTYKKISKLKKKQTYYVQTRTYKTVGGVKYYSNWSSVRSVKTK